MGNRRATILCLLLAAALAGCGERGAAPGVSLPAGSWKLVGFGEGEPLAPGVEASLEFADGRVSGSSGCNRYSADVAFEAGRLTIGPVAGTRMACPAPQMEVESRFGAALAEARGYILADSSLALLDEEAHPLLRFERGN